MLNTDFLGGTEVRKIVDFSPKYKIVEYVRDMSVTPGHAETAYFMATMNVHLKQLAVVLNNDAVILQAGAMQWFGGRITVNTGVKGVGDFAKKLVGASVTGETAVKPIYTGTGIVVLEPTYKHLIKVDVADWNNENNGMVITDGFFLACDPTVNISVVARRNISSAALGGAGIFNSCLSGQGIAILESPVPYQELVTIVLDNDELKVDGSFAVAWSNSLEFTVERTTGTLIGSAASGEGLVNVYRGTGRVLLAPVK